MAGSVDDYSRIDFTIYPNPVSNSATFNFNNFNKQIQLELYSINGQLVTLKKYSNTDSIVFNCEKFKSGTYF